MTRLLSALHGGGRSGNDPTGDAISRIATGIRQLVIGLAMNDKRGTPVMEERVLTHPERHQRGMGNQYTGAIGGDQQIREIAGMVPCGVL